MAICTAASPAGADTSTDSDPFYNELLEGADSELGRLGYVPAFVKTFVEVNTRQQIIELGHLHPIDGLLVLGELDGGTCLLWQGVTPHIVAAPSVISPNVSAITYDGCQAMRRLLDHLVGLGHRRIGLIVGQSAQTIHRSLLSRRRR